MSFPVDRAYELVEGAHQRGRLAHALLVTGPPGCGKESLAARIVTMLRGAGGGENLFGEPAVVEPGPLDELADEATRIVRPAMKSRRIGIAAIRELEKMVHMAVDSDSWKVGVIVEAERMGEAAENAFLKTLEEPPPRTLILMLSAAPQALLPTIRSRCLQLSLHGEGVQVGEHGGRLLEVLAELGGEAIGSPRGALVLHAAAAAVLAELREQIDRAADAAFKSEVEHYKKTTEGDWLERREKEHEAMARSEYLRQRQSALDLLGAWLGDVLRQKAGGSKLDFPDHAEITAGLSGNHGWPDLLARVEAFEELRRTLETNAQEQLALEVGFLRVFG
jgi:DNA polymerase-3 subunit delta'